MGAGQAGSEMRTTSSERCVVLWMVGGVGEGVCVPLIWLNRDAVAMAAAMVSESRGGGCSVKGSGGFQLLAVGTQSPLGCCGHWNIGTRGGQA